MIDETDWHGMYMIAAKRVHAAVEVIQDMVMEKTGRVM